LDTPALLVDVDVDVMEKNVLCGQQKANSAGVRLRPHIKTHRILALAKKQVKLGANGTTVVRPGTYIFLDAAQGNLLGSYERCALPVLTTITNRPTPYHVVIDAGTKALSAFVRGVVVCQTRGFGLLKEEPTIYPESLSNEYGVFTVASEYEYPIGDKLQYPIILVLPVVCTTIYTGGQVMVWL